MTMITWHCGKGCEHCRRCACRHHPGHAHASFDGNTLKCGNGVKKHAATDLSVGQMARDLRQPPRFDIVSPLPPFSLAH